MRITQFTVAFAVLCAALLAFSVSGFAADNDPVTVSGILSAAGCPLTDAQQKTIADIEPGEGMRDFMMGLGDLFTDEQNDALIAALGEQQFRGRPGGGGMGGGNRPPRPRNLYQVIILEKEGVPMTEGQINELNSIEPGQGMFQAMQDIYTDEQSEAMQKYMGGMGGPGGGMRGGGMR